MPDYPPTSSPASWRAAIEKTFSIPRPFPRQSLSFSFFLYRRIWHDSRWSCPIGEDMMCKYCLSTPNFLFQGVCFESIDVDPVVVSWTFLHFLPVNRQFLEPGDYCSNKDLIFTYALMLWFLVLICSALLCVVGK